MKKTAAALLVLVLALSGVPSALAGLPHAHGNDFDHSRHAGCAVHFFQNHSAAFAAIPSMPSPEPVRSVSSPATVFSETLRFIALLSEANLRAPPALPFVPTV